LVAEHNTLELIEMGKKAVDFALKNGAQEVEAFLSFSSGTSINIERGQIVKSEKSVDQGLGVRAIYQKAVGFSYTNILSTKTVEDAAVRAYKAAKASKPDPTWVSLPYPRKYGETKDTYDKKVEDMTSDQLVDIASTLLDTVTCYDKRVLAVDGGVAKSVFGSVVINSHGIEVSDLGTAVGCSVETIARDGTNVTPACFEMDTRRNFGIDPVKVGTEAARQAVCSLNAQKMWSGVFPVIFTQSAFRPLLYYTVINAVKADFVLRDRSAFKYKLGKNVASEIVTVCDDGLLEGGLLTRKFDGEGVPCQKTAVIENGVLKNFLYDNYSANNSGTKSTGNASRSGGESYASTPVLEVNNFVFSSGTQTTDQMINQIQNGLIVYGVQGAHSSNPESGEFSVVATPVWKIENGTVTHALRDVMLTGVFFDVLKNISGLGNNVRQLGQFVAPWVKVESIKAVGAI